VKTKKNKFNCDVNGSIMVTAALRYSLGRHTYVPGAVQDWISLHWDSLDSNTKVVIVRDVFEHIYDTNRINSLKLEPMFEYDLQSWENFAIQRYWQLNYDERKSVEQQLLNDKKRVVWYTEQIMPKGNQTNV
jgi:hypothetical protein